MLTLAKNIIATEDGLGIYLVDINALVLGDLHLGIELALLGEGAYIPVDQYSIIQNKILDLIHTHKPGLLIINGDFKHEFGRASPQEWFEFQSLSTQLTELDIDLELVRGNHDNYLKNILAKQGNTIREPYYLNSKYLFMHGHQSLAEVFSGALPDIDWLILSHEHPMIELRDEMSGVHKFKCYLKGAWEDCHVLVLPAYSPFASGTRMNKIDRNKLLSPVLKEIEFELLEPIVVDKGEL
jgi:putative SbcD/Mre11-related phosphoesterase